MKSIVVLDVPSADAIPESLLGCPAKTARLGLDRVEGSVHHPSEILTYLDLCHDDARDLVVVSVDEAPTFEADFGNWGLGWRIDRDLRTSWIAVAMAEGRITQAAWYQVDGAGFKIKGSSTKPGLGYPLANLLAAESTAVFVVRGRGVQKPRFRDQDLPSTDQNIRLWHGSPVGGLSRLAPPSAGRLWVSSSSSFAVCFGASPYSNHGFFHGVERVSHDLPQIYLLVPNDRLSVLDRPCSLYQVEVEIAHLGQEGVPGFEFFLHQNTPVQSERWFPSVAEALSTFGIAPIEIGTTKVDNSLLESCRPHRVALEGWLGVPLNIAVQIPGFEWRIKLWFVARGLESMAESDLPWLQRVIRRAWLPWVTASGAGDCVLPEYGYHSVAHLVDVAGFSALLAIREGVNPVAAALFGVLHDAARKESEPESDHAAAGVRVFERMLASDIRYLLLPQDIERIRVAIAGHSLGEQSRDPLIGVCWDADRLRLTWERGFATQFFSTPSGVQAAKSGVERLPGTAHAGHADLAEMGPWIRQQSSRSGDA